MIFLSSLNKLQVLENVLDNLNIWFRCVHVDYGFLVFLVTNSPCRTSSKTLLVIFIFFDIWCSLWWGDVFFYFFNVISFRIMNFAKCQNMCVCISSPLLLMVIILLSVTPFFSKAIFISLAIRRDNCFRGAKLFMWVGFQFQVAESFPFD